MEKVFGIYGHRDKNEALAIFDRVWKVNDVSLVEFTVGSHELIGAFRPKDGIEVSWLKDPNVDETLLLRIDSTVYDAVQVMNGKAADHVEQLWSAWLA